MKHVVALLALLLLPVTAQAAIGPAEKIAAVVAAPDLPQTLREDTIEQRFSPVVRLKRRATTPVILFTDAGAGSSVWVRSAMARFAADGRARVRLEFTPSPELTFTALAEAIEIQRGAPTEKTVIRRRWDATDGVVRLLTATSRDNGDEVLVLELEKEPLR
ncbi:hypothetical protein [Roseiterribacter gracilis]|uniref:Uncharacterized protein n=1 Tax=Roseiterribacter gracilis TaxID=2812848 RepID=A0A8S8XCP8_9PROT|nr:hypothetical protein TMPK1_18680 [Rhodospirillales bacterium TMPK1]